MLPHAQTCLLPHLYLTTLVNLSDDTLDARSFRNPPLVTSIRSLIQLRLIAGNQLK